MIGHSFMNMLHYSERYRCVDGRIMRHDPQADDPYLETDVGRCEDCDGMGCVECPDCGKMNCDTNH